MVVDTSVIIAILFDESDKDFFRAKLESANRRFISAASVLEASMVFMGRTGVADISVLDTAIAELQIEMVDVNAQQVAMAQNGFALYGRGRHRAKLNLGDCFSYALAKVLNEPLLFKGNDFSETDVLKA
jgi:ribonuclease VapC